jgi:hypothetical protein
MLLCACASVLSLAAQSGALPTDVVAALHALARVANTKGERANCSCEALRRLCAHQRVLDVALEVGIPAKLVAVPAACGGASGSCSCARALHALAWISDGAAPLYNARAAQATLQAGGASAVARALQCHAESDSAYVASAACMLLQTLTLRCGAEAA